ncbi:hypothetical protein KFU94_64070 [Chloroflexi bacterium TSY]|nr:hypothetical protein [Chloroflexi bacterium TSY]
MIKYTKSETQIGDISIEEIVLDAFTAFWRFYTPDKLEKADRLNSVLQYLKTCARTSVLQARRNAQKPVPQTELPRNLTYQENSSFDPLTSSEDVVLRQDRINQLWELVDSCCKDEKEHLIARLSLVSNLMPKSILALYPEIFIDADEISTTRRNLKSRLWRNKNLRDFLESLE